MLTEHCDCFDPKTHNGAVTMFNPASGNHRTLRIRTQPSDASFCPGERIVALLNGPDNENSYQGFGFVKPDGRIILWRRYADSKTFQTYADMLTRWKYWRDQKGIEYLVEGRCRVCNRLLTDPISITQGIGPVCAERAMGTAA